MSRDMAFTNAVGRFGLGVGGVDPAALGDPRGYVRAQLAMASPMSDAGLNSTRQQLQMVIARRQATEAARAAKTDGVEADVAEAMQAAGANRPTGRPRELDAWLAAATATKAPYQERLFLHWSNHFTVSAVKGKVGLTVGPFQREAIRPHLLGSFRDMAAAAILHPSMIYYLDNEASVGPASKVGRVRKSGLNENLGREVLELHTLGADGGYTQKDVTALSAVLTGWTVDLNPKSRTFGELAFEERRHQPGPKTVLGQKYPDGGPDQFHAVLHDLARHPSTARNVTRRLARAFVSDAVSDELQTRLMRVFLETDGDLRALADALASSDEAWTTSPVKMRPPMEFLAGTARLIGRVPGQPSPNIALIAMGQPFLIAPSPKGWPENDDAWATSDGIKSRVDWAQELAGRYAGLVDLRALVGGPSDRFFSDETRRVILQGETPEQALALLMLSPDFQRR